MSNTGDLLLHAAVLVRSRAWSDASTAVLATWRACRDPRLLQVLDVLAGRAGSPRPPVPMPFEAWARAVSSDDPIEVGQACQQPFDPADWRRQVAALRASGPDPRVGRWAENALWRGGRGPFPEGFVAGVGALLVANLDPALARSTWLRHESEFAVALQTMGEHRPVVDAGALAALKQALAEDPPEALLQAVYDQPDDMNPRAVYADWLSARGDSRGEFIHLQLAAATGASAWEQRRRASELWEENGDLWYPELRGLLGAGSLCRAGFLDHVRVLSGMPDDAAWLCCASAWRTVQSLDLSFAAEEFPGCLDHPVFRNVREVDHLIYRDLLPRVPLPWTSLGLSGELTNRRWDDEDAETTFPNLAAVTLRWSATALLDERLPLWDHVQELTIEYDDDEIPESRWRWIPKLRRVVLRSESIISGQYLKGEDGSWTFTRGPNVSRDIGWASIGERLASAPGPLRSAQRRSR